MTVMDSRGYPLTKRYELDLLRVSSMLMRTCR